MTRHGALAAFVALFLILAQVATAAAAPAGQQTTGERAGSAAPIDEDLQRDLKAGTATKILVEFDAKANLNAAKKIKERTKRGNAVLKALETTAAASQKTAKATVAKTKGAKATSYWLTNVLVVEADAKTLDKIAKQLARHKGVTSIRAPRVYPLVKPVETKVAILAAAGDPEWGVEKIRADEAWLDGVLGQGVVVANVDTGVDYTHPALIEQYRGNTGGGTFDHDFNWWDPTGVCGPEPCDNAAHGTHTMGTIVGGDGPGPFAPDTGVAPGAEWIAAKGCEDFFCTETSLLSSGQFILAPTDLNGENPNPALAPHVVNNSWGSGPGDTFYLETVQAWRAAGIIPVFSSGNPGPFCGEGGSPGDFLESFSAGATDDNDEIADFSGRGPSVFGKINPDVAAPGVDVVSSVPGGGYESFSGTSMAAPHVVGTLALMLSAEAALIGDVTAATDAVRTTAVDHLDDSCGGDEDGDPNNVYGDGRIDAKAAVDLVATGGTLAGTVTDSATSAPIAGARVTANDGARDFSAVTDTNGDYDLFLAAGTYLVTAEAFGYAGDFASGVVIVTDETTDQDFGLVLLPRFTVTGTITASEDGSPIEGATVKAIGTPVPAAVTNASGDYSLELPIGTYTLRATANGCTETAEATVTGSLEDEVVDQDFNLFRKLDDFGHACAPIPFDWVDATGQSALYGDEFAGRLHLPFEFPFYDGAYEQIFLSDNGYMNFLAAEQFNNFPQGIPSPNPPNAAIYALWQDLRLDAVSSIDYEMIGSAPDRAFVISYADVKARGASGTLSFQVKLWESGAIDLLYGDNPANPADGRNATVGIEDATGTDALEIGFMEPVLSPNSAIRITEVPTGIVTGVVTDANDGSPIVGATVKAMPGGREAQTDETGAYRLRLLPGNYTITASKDPYEPASSPAVVVDDVELTVDFALNAAIASVEPTEITETVEYGATTTVPITIGNTGTADLTWEARERLLGMTSPELPPAVSVTRNPGWGPVKDTAGVPLVVVDDTVPNVTLTPIISDPAGDAQGSVDIISVRAGSDGSVLAQMALDFTGDTPIDEVGGFVFLDIDQDPDTGLPAEAIFGKPTQDVGMEYFVDIFGIHDPEPVVFIVNVETFEAVAAPASIDGQTVLFDIPLEAIGGHDGAINTAMVVGDFFQPTDWAPDEGHGTIEPFTDLPWIVTEPGSGTVAPDGSQIAQVTLGGAGLAPGNYQALLVLVTNDPHAEQLPIAIDLTVEMPEEFGAISGTVSDAHSGEPLPGVSVTVASEWPAGTPLELSATTADDGTYTIVGPEGTWPATFSLDGFLPVTSDVTIVRGVTTGGNDAALHRIQPHAVLDGEVPVFILTPDRTGSVTLQLGNPGGHADLEVEIGEVDLGGASSEAAVAGSTTKVTLPAGADRNARTTKGLGDVAKGRAVPRGVAAEGDVLASWPAGMELPWGVAYDGGVWLSDPIDLIDVHFSTEGERGDEFSISSQLAEWGADMAFDTARNLIWQVNVGGDNGIYGLDPADGSVEQVITGSPWDGISQRGLAYDPDADVFYIGGWNEGIVYKVAGPSHPTPGETLNECSPPDDGISGLAWNRSFGMLWEATNSESDTIWLIDPVTCDASVALSHPDGGGFGGAGLEIDVVGNLWTVGQNSGNAYLIESGLPTFSDVPWLTASPTEATIAPDGSIDVDIAVDSTGLEPGVYRALVVILTNDPSNSLIQLPVTLVVPTFQQGVDAGGGASTNANGDVFAADRGYVSGPYGYLGSSSIRSTSAAIGGTEDDGLYQDARTGMAGYRFDVPNGIYRVDLLFAEIENVKVGARKFDVSMEGDVVLPGLDIMAAAGGKNIALDRTFIVSVSDGHIDIDFAAQRGDKPIVNAILVTGLPEGAPGT
jgi:subtilisin family serine protease